MEPGNPSDGESIEPTSGVHLTQLEVGERMSIHHFLVEPGATVDIHSHPHEQMGLIIRGDHTFIFDGADDVVVHAGESFYVPADKPHGAENRGTIPVEGIDIFSPPHPLEEVKESVYDQ